MVPMCDINTGLTVGWAIAQQDCDAVVTVTYLDAATNATTTTKPTGWEYCRPGFSSDTIYSVVQMTQVDYDALVSKDPNTLYVIVG